MTGDRLPHPPVPRNSHRRVHWRRGLMQFAWKDSHVASSQNHLYKMKSLRFTKPSYYKILALNSTQGIPHHPFNLCLQCCGAWSNLGVRFRTSSSGRLPNFWRCQHQALFYLFLPGHVLSFFFGFQQTVSHFMFCFFDFFYIYIYLYIYLEPKWPLFRLERAFFWRVEAPKSFSPSNYFRKGSERETPNLKLENETSEHQSFV